MTTGEDCAAVGLQEGVNCRTIAGQGLDIGSPLKTGLGKQDLTAQLRLMPTRAWAGVWTAWRMWPSTPRARPVLSYYRQYDGRMDANVTQKDRLSFAIYWVPQGSTSYNGGARAYNLFHHDQINDAFSVIWNHTFSPSFLNEARANACGLAVERNQRQLAAAGWASAGQHHILRAFGHAEPLRHLDSAAFSTSGPMGTRMWRRRSSGSHTIKFGADDSYLHYLNNPVGRPSYNFYNIWDFLNDAPSARERRVSTA